MATVSIAPDDTMPRDVTDADQPARVEGLGLIPFVLRIGVTGHRQLADPVLLGASVREGLLLAAGLLPPASATSIVLVAVSALAEGADRLVTSQILATPGSRLEVALPLPRTQYARDFATEESRQDFRRLLASASRCWQAPKQPTREEAYERAGRHIADNCDVLIAVWDGEPARGRGGTGEIVAYARANGVPLIWIRTDGQVTPELDVERAGTFREAAVATDDYNRRSIPQRAFDSQMERYLRDLGLGDSDAGPFLQAGEQVAAWLLPFFVRADLLALRFHRRFITISVAMFALAAVAVAIVAAQISFWPAANWVVAFEVVILLCLLGAPLLGSRLRLPERWASYRFLAERLRSAYFLALAGTGDRAGRDRPASFSDPAVAWIERALGEITARRARPNLDASDVAALRDYLTVYWIDRQQAYHSQASAQHERMDTRLRQATAALFMITLISALLHLVGVGHHQGHGSGLAATFIMLSISIPAAGAAVHGIATQGLYRQHAKRYQRMTQLLVQLSQHMQQAEDLAQIQHVAVDVERVMREESNDWFGVMRFHDVELIA